MRCRRMVRANDGHYDIVWFGSYGTEKKLYTAFTTDDDKIAGSVLVMTPSIYVYDSESGTYNAAKKINASNINYASEQEGVAYSLVQRLLVIKNELWYDYEYGMPLIDKIKLKGIIDAYIIKTVLKHPDVIEVKQLDSTIYQNTKYVATVIISTIYGDIKLEY